MRSQQGRNTSTFVRYHTTPPFKLLRIKVAVSVAQKAVMLLFVVTSYMICINMHIERKIKQFCITLGPHTFILGKQTFTCMSLEENNLSLENPFPFSKNRSAEIFITPPLNLWLIWYLIRCLLFAD